MQGYVRSRVRVYDKHGDELLFSYAPRGAHVPRVGETIARKWETNEASGRTGAYRVIEVQTELIDRPDLDTVKGDVVVNIYTDAINNGYVQDGDVTYEEYEDDN